MNSLKPLILAVVAVLLAATAPDAAAESRPKIGLVLGGGGARGLAHIGVIRALEERNIKIDAIAGASMGAIVGALYASGKTPDEMERITITLDWGRAFADEPPRESLSFRRKQDSRDYLVKAQATLKGGVLSLPKGVVQGQNLQQMLQNLYLHASDITDFDKLPIPYRAVAADLATGEAVVFKSGDLATAVRASMSIPALYAPVELDGRLLVDGGVANNVPVDVVKTMGVDHVIVVDIGTPLYSADELDSVFPIIEQLTTLLTQNNVQKQLTQLTETDVLIQPELETVQSADFDMGQTAITVGYEAVQEHLPQLAEFEQFNLQRQQVDTEKPQPNVVSEITINNDSFIADKVISALIDQDIGEIFDKEQLEDDAEEIYGLGYFEAVNYRLLPGDDGDILQIATREKSWGQDLAGVSFELFTDNDGENGYNLGANYRKHGVSAKGGDWFSVVQLGKSPLIRSELHLPLDYRRWFFFKPYFSYSETRFNQVDGGNILSRFNIDDFSYGAFIGTEMSNVAMFGVGVERHVGHTDTFVGADQGTTHFRDRNSFMLLEYDTLDNLYFPNSGTLASIRYDSITPSGRLVDDFDLLSASLLKAVRFRDNSLLLGAEYVRSSGAVTERLFQSSLGGFLHLSGFPDDALVGANLLFTRLTYLHRLDEQSFLPVDLPVYLGISVEAGNVWQDNDDLSGGDLIYAGSVMLGVDSPLGPLYIGYGKAEEGVSSFYLRLGRVF
jgi:NTE family protein|tara:strand:- start:4407 stop:6596 length:2190 start_codon:yes stop_codon:yes gene_type:complete